MKSKKSIGVIGQGFVGGSLTTVMAERGLNVYAFDKAGTYKEGSQKFIYESQEEAEENFDKNFPIFAGEKQVIRQFRYPTSISDLVLHAEAELSFTGVFFVCLPTPMFEDGSADLSIVEGALREIAEAPRYDPSVIRIAVVKSTVPPGSTENWNKKFEGKLAIVFNPEFLTEANALNDMRNQNRIVLGGPRPHINKVKQIFQSAFPNVPLIKTSSTTAEFVKYFTNIHLMSRVVLSCEMWQMCNKLDELGMNVDYDKVVEYSKYDQRLGNSHMSVPGPDGIPGARGHCFPKDLNALIDVAKKIGVDPTMMESIWKKNLEIVKPEHRDWEKMHGRAVSKKS